MYFIQKHLWGIWAYHFGSLALLYVLNEPRGVLFPGKSWGRLAYEPTWCSWSVPQPIFFVLFCLSASVCGAATAVPVLGIVQWGQNQVDSLTCTQAAPACSGNSNSAASSSETLDLLTSVYTNKSIRLLPWERTRSKGCCYWWLRRWQFWVLWNEIRWITLDGVNKSQAAVSWAITAFIFCAILLFLVHFLAVVNALCSRGAITSICNSMFLCLCSTWWSTLTCCLWIPMG